MATTMQNLTSRRNGMDINSLPAKYQAVTILCRRLRIRYHWIDSLRIIQVTILTQNPRFHSLKLSHLKMQEETSQANLIA
jgi:hypothetical protein